MNENSYETWKFLFRKKIRRINLMATAAGTVIWRPAVNEQFMLAHAILKIHQTGTNTDAPNIKLTNGTTDIVAAVDTLVTDGVTQRLTVTGNAHIDNDNPLTFVCSDAGNGSTVLTMDLTLVAFKISDIG